MRVAQLHETLAVRANYLQERVGVASDEAVGASPFNLFGTAATDEITGLVVSRQSQEEVIVGQFTQEFDFDNAPLMPLLPPARR